MKRSLVAISVLALLLGACRSHKATVIRPAANAERTGAQARVPAKLANSDDYNVDPKLGAELVTAARGWLGTPYKYGGETKSGADCSGMLMSVYRDVAGLSLPRNSAAQRDYCFDVSRKRLQPGDLVFFSSSAGGRKVSHVGMYVGNGRIIHASSSRGVIVSELTEKYYDSHYHSSGRVYGVTLAATGNKSSRKTSKSDKTGNKTVTKKPEVAAQPIVVADETRPVPKVREVSLDDFIAAQKTKKTDSLASDSTGIVSDTQPNHYDSIPAKTEPLDSLPAKADTIDSLPAKNEAAAKPAQEVSHDNLPGPQVIVDGKRRPSAPQRVEKRDSVAADSVRRASEIRDDVAKAMKFGK